MDDDELLSILESEAAKAIGGAGSASSTHRIDAMKAYRGDADSGRLKSEDGASQVVYPAFRNTIHWMMPDLMRVVIRNDRAVVFAPVGPEDEEEAEQETDVVNHIVMHDNDGPRVMATWLKDGLMFRLGWVKYWFDETGELIEETYRGLTQLQVGILETDDGIEIIGNEADEPAGSLAEGAFSEATFTVRVRRSVNGPGVVIEPVPPEEVLFCGDARTAKSARYIEHRRLVPVSELIADGMSREDAEQLPTASGGRTFSGNEAQERLPSRAGIGFQTGGQSDSTRVVEVGEAWIRVDYDDDGIAELRRVKYVPNGEILENDVAVACPLVPWSPILNQHTLEGWGIYDLTSDDQDVSSTLLRNGLNNLYMVGDGIWELPQGAAGPDTVSDLLARGPRVVRTAVGGQLQPLTQPVTAELSFAGLDQMRRITQEGTGIQPHNQGLDNETMNSSGKAVSLLQAAGNSQKELIASMFAEGMKTLMLGVHRLLREHADELHRKSVQIRGKWVPVDPSGWKHRADMNVKVGIGVDDEEKRFAILNALGGWFGKVIELQQGTDGPFMGRPNVANFLEDLVRAGGERTPERYIMDGKAPQPQEQSRPDPAMAEVEGRLRIEAKKAQDAAALDQMKAQAATELAAKKAANDAALAWKQFEHTAQLDMAKAQVDAQMKGQKLVLDAEKVRAEIERKGKELVAEIVIASNRADADAATKRLAAVNRTVASPD